MCPATREKQHCTLHCNKFCCELQHICARALLVTTSDHSCSATALSFALMLTLQRGASPTRSMSLAYDGEPVLPLLQKSECKRYGFIFAFEEHLCHAGTGEVASFNKPFRLTFDEQGLATVTMDGVSSSISEYLSKSLHWKQDDSGQSVYWIQGSSAESRYVHSCEFVDEKPCTASVEGVEVTVTMYVHSLPKGCLGSPQILFPCWLRLASLLYGVQSAKARFCKDRLTVWKGRFTAATGLVGDSHVRQGFKSCRAKGLEPDEEQTSISLLFMWVSLFSLSRPSSKDTAVIDINGMPAPHMLLQWLSTCFLPRTFNVTLSDGSVLDIEDMHFSVASWCGDPLTETFAAAMFGEPLPPRTPLLDGLHAMMRYKSSSSHKTKLSVRGIETMVVVGKYLCMRAFVQGGSGDIFNKALHELPVMPGQSKWRKKIPSSYKQSFVSTAMSSSKRTTPDQCMASATTFRPIPGEHVISRGVANAWTLVQAFEYVLQVRHCLQDRETLHISVACDAARIGGEEIMSLVLVLGNSDTACWLCPQVLRDHRGSLRLMDAPVTSGEIDAWRSATSSFVLKSDHRVNTALAAKPRVASRDFLLALHRALHTALGSGVFHYRSSLVDSWPLKKLVALQKVPPK
eukprot:5083476-Amphidinium_carterae.4